ncbi:pyrroline-5-carboxylate reductase [Candidatus Poribacteria bacterium]|nr:pyrroline-5-carboxylate reductase [Candidatus Poribacteria bacterium]
MPVIQQRYLGFIGAGNMAEALIRGLIAAETIGPSRIFISDINRERLNHLGSELAVQVAADNRELLERCGVLVLATKPQGLARVIEELAGLTQPQHLFVSILAGTRTSRIERGLRHEGNPEPRVVRVMPNTPALLRAGAAAIAPGAHALEDDVRLARVLFESVGVAVTVEAAVMDAVTGVSGSGPAYVFQMIQAMIDAARVQGIPEKEAALLVKQTVYGAAVMARNSALSPAELTRQVASPGGTTEAGLKVLSGGDFAGLVNRTIDAATKRSIELGAD